MAGQEESLRLAAEVVDKFSKPLKDLQRSLRSLSATASDAHKLSTVRAKDHEEALCQSSGAKSAVSERMKADLRPERRHEDHCRSARGLRVPSGTAQK
jgi:hypothetical protein